VRRRGPPDRRRVSVGYLQAGVDQPQRRLWFNTVEPTPGEATRTLSGPGAVEGAVEERWSAQPARPGHVEGRWPVQEAPHDLRQPGARQHHQPRCTASRTVGRTRHTIRGGCESLICDAGAPRVQKRRSAAEPGLSHGRAAGPPPEGGPVEQESEVRARSSRTGCLRPPRHTFYASSRHQTSPASIAEQRPRGHSYFYFVGHWSRVCTPFAKDSHSLRFMFSERRPEAVST
jgi:hypothetical protein